MGDSSEAGEGLPFFLDVCLGAPCSVLDDVDAGFGWDAVEADVAEDVAGAGVFGWERFEALDEAAVEDGDHEPRGSLMAFGFAYQVNVSKTVESWRRHDGLVV